MLNKYSKRAHIYSNFLSISRNTINRYMNLVREKVAELCGEAEVKESYFKPKRVKGKRGRGSGAKKRVFEILRGMDRRIQK